MTVEWLVRALAAGALLTVAALAASPAAGWFRLPRRGIWAAALAGSLLLPALSLAAPGVLPQIRLPEPRRTQIPAQAGPPSPGITPTAAAAAEPPVVMAPRPLPRAVLLGWLAASLAMLTLLAWSYARLNAIPLRRGPRVEGVKVLVAERAGPLVLGLVRPRVVLPRWVVETASDEERRLIVAHERAHIDAGDVWLLALASATVALMPWNPGLWIQHRRLRLAVETDCDARVLAAGASRRLYLHVLLRTAGHPVPLPALAPAWGERRSHLERRIVEMTSNPPARRLLRAAPLAALAVAVAAAACGVASKHESAPAGDPAILLDTLPEGGEVARLESNGTGIVIRRQEHDPGFGYTGMESSLYYPQRRHVMREGRRVMVRVDSFPVIVGVDRGSPAERAGIRAGDVLMAIDGHDTREPRGAGPARPGETKTYQLRRGGRELTVPVVAAPPRPQNWPPTEDEFREIDRRFRAMGRLDGRTP